MPNQKIKAKSRPAKPANKSLSITQAESKRAYQLVSADILAKLAKARLGESIRLGILGAFRKSTYQVKSEGKLYKGYKFTFRTFSALKELGKKK